MSKVISALCAALIATPLIIIGTEAAGQGAQSGGAQASPPPATGGGGGGGFRGGGGGGFRDRDGGGFRGGGFRGFYGGGFYGAFGPPFGFYDPWYDPFWGPRSGFGYGYGYGYYPPTSVIVRERVPAPGYLSPPDGPPPQQNWYRCDNPEGFYPYVRTCNGAWQSVPVTPPGAPQR